MAPLYSFSSLEATQQQLPLLSLEPTDLYHAPLDSPAKFALCHKTHPNGVVQQDLYPVDRIEWVARQIEQMKDRDRRHFWISQATLRGNATTRRISSIVLLNACWVDIDLLHPPAGFNVQHLPADAPAEQQAALLALMIEDAGLPPPTYIIATGGGLCPKWVFDASIPSEARPRWQSVQRYLVSKLTNIKYELCGRTIAWPVDAKASDASRVLRLVGTVNPRWNSLCRIVWQSGNKHDFDVLADSVLPFTRDDVSAFKSSKTKDFAQWDLNRAAANALGIKRAHGQFIEDLSDEAARTLWGQRFEFARALLDLRGGAQVGNRNNWWWVCANALAYSCGHEDHLMQELSALHYEYFSHSGWKRSEAMQCAGSVVRRLKAGGPQQLYKMKTATFTGALDLTSSERQSLADAGFSLSSGGKHNAKRDEWQHGAMGFKPMRGLDLDTFVAETRRRQAEAGRRSAEVRSTTLPLEMRLQAREMASKGMTQRAIAQALGVSQMTVSRWLSAV